MLNVLGKILELFLVMNACLQFFDTATLGYLQIPNYRLMANESICCNCRLLVFNKRDYLSYHSRDHHLLNHSQNFIIPNPR